MRWDDPCGHSERLCDVHLIKCRERNGTEWPQGSPIVDIFHLWKSGSSIRSPLLYLSQQGSVCSGKPPLYPNRYPGRVTRPTIWFENKYTGKFVLCQVVLVGTRLIASTNRINVQCGRDKSHPPTESISNVDTINRVP